MNTPNSTPSGREDLLEYSKPLLVSNLGGKWVIFQRWGYVIACGGEQSACFHLNSSFRLTLGSSERNSWPRSTHLQADLQKKLGELYSMKSHSSPWTPQMSSWWVSIQRQVREIPPLKKFCDFFKAKNTVWRVHMCLAQHLCKFWSRQMTVWFGDSPSTPQSLPWMLWRSSTPESGICPTLRKLKASFLGPSNVFPLHKDLYICVRQMGVLDLQCRKGFICFFFQNPPLPKEGFLMVLAGLQW